MPAGSTSIWQEGLIIPPVRLGDDVLRVLLANVRTPEIRRVDLEAQAAANRLAGERLSELIGRRGLDTVLGAFDEVIAYAGRRAREAIGRLPDGRYRSAGVVEGDGVTEDDLPITVAVTVAGDAIEIDFGGTAPAAAGNVNAPFAVTRAACTFAVKVALGADVPVNAGLFECVTIRAPAGCLVDARAPSAVVAANVGDEPAHCRHRAARPRAGGRPPRAGPGDDEQRRHRDVGVDVLRDARRRPGRVEPGRRAVRRPRRDVEHAEHAD